MADDEDGLQVLDVSDPVHPQLVGTHPINGGAQHVAISVSCAYVAGDSDDLYVVSVEDPDNPKGVARYCTFDDTCGLAVLLL